MALYRCASCGSPNVVTDTQHSGVEYNYRKAIAGAVVFGTGGAVAGVQSKTYTVYKCADCGMTLSYPMPNDLKVALEIGLASAEMRDKLTFSGLPVPWSFFTGKYVNMCGKDKELPKETVRTVQNADNDEDAYDVFERMNLPVFDKEDDLQFLVPVIKERMKEPLADESKIKVLQAVWESERKEKENIFTEKKAELTRILKEGIKNETDEITSCFKRDEEKYENENKELLVNLERKQQILNSLGIFKGAEKQALRNEIASINRQISENTERLKKIPEEIKEYIERQEFRLTAIYENTVAELEREYSISTNPVSKYEEIKEFNLPPENSTSSRASFKNTIYNLILNIIKVSENPISISDITELIFLCGYDNIGSRKDMELAVSQFTRKMRYAGILERIEQNRKTYFKFSDKDNII